MIHIVYKSLFLREFGKLPVALQAEAKEKIALFRNDPRNPSLRTHELGGKFKGFFSFSVNYKYRIVFLFESKQKATFISIGDHDVYK